MPNHADAHDRDKLLRWQKDLAATPVDAPTVYAIFLVSRADTAAHDIFRAFRASFEERKAGFAHLVIFGQHGVSATVRKLQEALALPPDSPPTLVLFTDGEAPDIIALPPGAANGDEEGWAAALQRAEGVMGGKCGNGLMVREQVRGICYSVVESGRM